jgi:hypothetical protein
MGWTIRCTDSACPRETWATNIVDLIENHTDKTTGWFLCGCGKPGHIAKSYKLQEKGETFEPCLRGVLPLGTPGNTYQPFVFLISYEAAGPVWDLWFCYYKDTRSEPGGKLKLGHGPGGPPVLGSSEVLALVKKIVGLGILTKEQVKEALEI